MKPEKKSQLLLGVTRSKAKMLEYDISEEYHIKITQDPAKLFTISIGLLGDLAAAINRGDLEPTSLSELKNNLIFSARFFDSYVQSKLNDVHDSYLGLLGSASYYLCDLPGSAHVLANQARYLEKESDPDHLGQFILYLLLPDVFQSPIGGLDFVSGYFYERYQKISEIYDVLFSSKQDLDIKKSLFYSTQFESLKKNLLRWCDEIRQTSYLIGSPRQLLFSDIVAALMRKKLENSSWVSLSKYSGLSIEKWMPALIKSNFLKELWPAQHLLGKAGVLKGESAIVQMPTSAGKTKAMEMILRSGFLADRVSLAVIVAPFRALCHEIKNTLVEAFHDESIKVDELSDAIQTDFEFAKLLGHQQILVVTPEKLLYVLRRSPELANHIKLLVFDEGHQFDSGIRGITYELLLTSLRSMIPEDAQKVLISAVISNAQAVGEWLNGEPNVVEGTSLIPTFRSVGFASWLDQLGRIEYVDSRDAEQSEFFVPRVIERFNLRKKKRERADRFFPEKSDGQAIALYLGLKLVRNGGIAIFCGRKSTAAKVCEMAMDVIKRGVPLGLPLDFSNLREIERLTHLHIENLGADAPASQSAEHGIFSHHGNTPHGIRLSVEYAMREDLIRFVVCTSTLAQGVNLPIRYLIVTSVYQGTERIKVRDFHNLIGRAGRSGMHTEGSILFADPIIYDRRKIHNEKWRWEQVKELLEPRNAEPCISNLLSIFEPIKSDDDKYFIPMEALGFAKIYISAPEEVTKLAAGIATDHEDKGFSKDGVERQVAWRISLICAIESFLLSHLDETEDGFSDAGVIRLAKGTLAFFLADEQKKEHICELFLLLAKHISEKISDPYRRKVYGRTLFGVQDAQAIEGWVQSNAANLLSIVDEAEILDVVWPLLTKHINSGIFVKFDKPEVLKEIAHGWINGDSFGNLLKTIHKRKAKMIWGSRRREFKIDHVIDVCEGTLAYDGALLIGALCELVEVLGQGDTGDLIEHLQLFQKRLKYGLPTEATIVIYELGFSDRVISQNLAVSLNLSETRKKNIIKSLKYYRDIAFGVIDKYPSYFKERMSELLG